MASTTIVASSSNEDVLMDTLPIIDLRLLSQSELYSLSRCSSSTSPISQSNDDDVLIPKIDRSVFNESAGSRKQTYSRLRLAPRKPQFSPTSTSSINAVRNQSPERVDVESVQIISLFKQLFVAESHCTVNDNYGDEDDDLVLVDHIYDASVPDFSAAVFHRIPVDVIDSSCIPIKRKRGRPRKDDNRFTRSNGNVAPASVSGGEKRAEEDEEIVMDLRQSTTGM